MSSYSTTVNENWVLFLFFIIIILGWFSYLFIASNIGSPVTLKFMSKSWFVGILRLGTMLTKNLLNVSATSLSFEIIFSDII